MRNIVLAVLMVTIVAIPCSAQDQPIVSASWLIEHINDDGLVVLHVASSRRDYAPGHIPGSRFLWWGDIAPSTPDFATELPAIDDAQRILRDLGVKKDSRIVVAFGGRSVTSGTRTLWTLQYFGLGDRSYLLDGGVEAWKAAGGPWTTDVVTPEKGNVELRPHPEVFADLAYVGSNLTVPKVTIVDARSKIYYDGRPAGQPRSGHVRGAANIAYSDVVDSLNRFRPVEELRELFAQANVADGSTVVTYCHIGQQATVTLLAARLLGYDVRMYDGSFEEWGYLDDNTYPVEQADGQE